MMRCLCLITLVVTLAVPAGAADYDLNRNTVDGGGTTGTTAGGYKVSGSIAQPDAATLSAGGYRLIGGFLGGPGLAQAATPTTTSGATRTATATRSATLSGTATVTLTPARSATPTGTKTASQTPALPPTTPSTPTRTVSLPACTGDCNGDGKVTVDELILAVNIALGARQAGDCRAADRNDDGKVTIEELIGAVNNALEGCPTA